MYEELFTLPSRPQFKQPFNICLNPTPADERVAFVDDVCSCLINSRFGPGREWRLITDLRSSPYCERAVFCDLTIEGPVPSYTIVPDSEFARRCTYALFCHELENFYFEQLDREAQARDRNWLPASSQPRGSPDTFSGTQGKAITNY